MTAVLPRLKNAKANRTSRSVNHVDQPVIKLDDLI